MLISWRVNNPVRSHGSVLLDFPGVFFKPASMSDPGAARPFETMTGSHPDFRVEAKVPCFFGATVDGRNPKQPPGMVKNPINNGIIIILGGVGFCPSTVWRAKV